MTAEDQWQSFVSDLRSRPELPFEEHWSFFRKVFAGRAEEQGPPIVWRPSAERVRESNLAAFMNEVGAPDYRSLHAWAAAHREEFWDRAIRRLGIVFRSEPERVLDPSGGVKDPVWLPGAEMNIVESCFSAPPDRVAVVRRREGEAAASLGAITYGALERLARRVAGALRARGCGPEGAVALYMPMTLECVAACLGALIAGAPIVSIADSFSAEELKRRIAIGRARAILTAAGYLRAGKRIDPYEKVVQANSPPAVVVPSGRAAPPALREEDVLWEDFLEAGESLGPEPGDPYRMTHVLFSSGTTGEPKAIPWTQLTPIKCAADGHFHQDIHPSDTVAWPTNVGWMMGPWLIYATFINRATMALYEGAPHGRDFVRFVRDARVSVLGVVPSLVRSWRASDAFREVSSWTDVRVLSSTGEPSHREDYLWLMSRTGYRAPVIEYLGGTEIGGGHLTGTVVQPCSPSTFTTPALGIDFVILDESGRPVPDGNMGELFLIPPSIGLSQRLLNRDHEREYYEGCPRGPRGEVLRRHGDQIARLHAGFYKAAGRADDAMNLGGIKVSAVEIEQAVEDHEAVYGCAAIGVQPEGEGAEKLVLYVVPQGEVEPERLRGELAGRIAARLNPLFRIHDVIAIDELPRTASNKLMRRALRVRYLEEAARRRETSGSGGA